MADKPQEIYHYTTGQCFYRIVEDGVIKLATAGVPKGERPAVWFAINPDWDATVNQICLNPDGSLIKLNREETAKLGGGLVRFVVEPKCAPYTFREFVKRSRIEKKMAQAM